MAGYVSEFATGAAIEAILKKANSSQSVSQSEKTAWNNKQNKLAFTELWFNDDGTDLNVEYTLSDNINNYTIVFLKICSADDKSQNFGYLWGVYVPSKMQTGETYAWQGYWKRHMTVEFNGTKMTQTRRGAEGESSSLQPKIYGVYGLK